MKDLRAIILAAGKGTRMKSSIPKVLHRVCGKPMIDYVVNVARKTGSLKIAVVLGHQYREVRAYLGKNVNTVKQKRLVGTADAVKCAQPLFRNYRGDVLILCGDTPLLRTETIKELVRRHKKSGGVCTFLTAVVDQPRGYGRIIRGAQGVPMAIREENDATEMEKNIVEINVGAYCFKSQELFAILKEVRLNKKKKEFYLTDIIELLSERGQKVGTLETEDALEGLGINDRGDLARCERVLGQRVLTDLMRKGVTIRDPQSTFIDANVTIGVDTVIYPFTVIEENVKIGAKCSIGPFAHLRPGTQIKDHAVVGNFTEVSRSRLGPRTLMKHFGFLGDARVGSGANIGAGTVTANYDGRDKNLTVIGDQAFIGSDSILVAPVKIGKKARTGAGCVVVNRRTVPDGSTVVGVPARVLAKGKKRK